jgi:hypothetical protein
MTDFQIIFFSYFYILKVVEQIKDSFRTIY